jgi:hypothetical protein
MPGRIEPVSPGDRPSSERQNKIGQALEQHDSPANAIVDDLGTATRPTGVERNTPLRMVKVAKDGGVSGGAAATCTWTYTVKTLKDVTLETTISPQKARWPNTAYLEAAAGGRSEYALAQYVSGTLILMCVEGEIQDTNVCP